MRFRSSSPLPAPTQSALLSPDAEPSPVGIAERAAPDPINFGQAMALHEACQRAREREIELRIDQYRATTERREVWLAGTAAILLRLFGASGLLGLITWILDKL
ncbi:MAG: hypothetical protein AAF194_03560 [Pseudomonadota bacterium]